jgi:hypothetical protein
MTDALPFLNLLLRGFQNRPEPLGVGQEQALKFLVILHCEEHGDRLPVPGHNDGPILVLESLSSTSGGSYGIGRPREPRTSGGNVAVAGARFVRAHPERIQLAVSQVEPEPDGTPRQR